LNDTFSTPQHLAVPKSQDPEPARLQILSSLIIVTLARISVLLAIELDNQPCSDADEVNDVLVDGDLSAEFVAVEISISEDRPEALFGFGGIASQRARTSEWFRGDQAWRMRSGIDRQSHFLG
jgi:hypothetical protein